MTVVVDASALLAFVHAETGSDVVAEALESGAVVSAANWSEVAQKVLAADRDWGLVRGLLLSFELRVEPVTEADGELAARLWRRGGGWSLGDRLCMALGERLDADVLTCDTAWGADGRVRQIR